MMAHVISPGGPEALRNHAFDDLGLPRLYVAAEV